MSIRVLLAVNHPIVLWGLEKFINESPQIQVAGKATNGAEALLLVREQQPHILLLDPSLGRESGVDLIPGLLAEGNFHVIIFTEIRDRTAVDTAVLNGARGVVYKEEPAETILKAIEKVHKGELWLDRSTTGRIFISLLRPGKNTACLITEKITTLTPKERAIVNAFAEESGASNKKIARTLCISEQTLRNHLTSIFSKLDITNRFDLFMFAKLHRQEIGPPMSRLSQSIPSTSSL
ncbi:LuxR family two component transcriptional regulator [Nitrosospira multiformis]|jgi:DNA-binding NarL/FixJ family response regulator|uniref:LuxR family two component transcriptional regulator n=1 Tax=Nitrosospira multiformis TaxID=1231 RepID=A0A2T5IGB0_9PROT|nr:response regulator transcription factor [Nitrosospira multiformis]PTQ82876.1 LuxR family two component transcriptional regulator [Nitrosospira multiformis]